MIVEAIVLEYGRDELLRLYCMASLLRMTGAGLWCSRA